MTTPRCGYIPGEWLQSGWSSSLPRINKAHVHGTTAQTFVPPRLGIHKLVCKENKCSPRCLTSVGALWGFSKGGLLTAFSKCQGGRGLPHRAMRSPGRAFSRSHRHALTDWGMGPFTRQLRGLNFPGILTTFSYVNLGNWGLVFLSSSLRGQTSPGLCLSSLFKNLSFAVTTQILKAG